MQRGLSILLVRSACLMMLGTLRCDPAFAQDTPDPQKLIEQADGLGWLRAWTRAVPLYEEAERLFTARGDRRNALYAQISRLRGELPRLPVPEVSQRLADYLEDPTVQADERLRLRTLVIKGDTDVDLDPSLAEQSWNDALRLSEKLGESAWANRARGELGLIAFLLGDINNAVIKLGLAMKGAESNGDVSSRVRWLTLFGHGYVELGRPELALEYYDRALKLAATVRELQFPVMTHLGKGDALVKLGRFSEAEKLLNDALAVASEEGALGYQAELTLKQGQITYEHKQTSRALETLARAMDLARKAGGNRILAQISLELAKMQRETGRIEEAVATLRTGIDVARSMGEHLLLPRLLAQFADLRVSQRQYGAARELLEEAHDILESLLTHASSPWVRSRVIGGMDDVSVARARLEGAQGNATRLFAVLEQAKGRSLLDLLSSTPVADVRQPAELRAGERRIAALQLQLLRTQSRVERRRLLDRIFAAEEQLAPISTELFSSTRTAPRKPFALSQVQRTLRSDEVLLDFAVAEPNSYAVVATTSTTRVQRLPGRDAIRKAVESLLAGVRESHETSAPARALGEMLLDVIPEISSRTRVVVSPDGALHQLPFELLVTASGRSLLESHVVSYVPSGSVLAILRTRRVQKSPRRMALAVSGSPESEISSDSTKSGAPATPAITRGVYDVDASRLPPLPSANDEARAVVATLGPWGSTVLLGQSASEVEFKKQPLHDYQVLHFAVHGILSTKFPARSALLLRPAGAEDGLLQAREILMLRLAADLVTLSACDTGTGTTHGQDGVASLVRPFLAAGARTVVANLWTADDAFSLALMREFYRQLAAGTDIGEALRRAKLKMVQQFGPQALPKLWGGVLVYGDGAGVVKRARAATE